MTGRGKQIAAGMPQARVVGRRWGVAMSEMEWDIFSTELCSSARLRLLAIFEHFCDHGEALLPRGAFRWLSSTSATLGAARQGAFEAHGVVVRGHAAPTPARPTFFVTSIEQDPPAPGSARRVRGLPDPRQQRFPFNSPSQQGNDDG